MIISTDPNIVNQNGFKKWVDFQEEEKCVAWFGKGFVSYNKGYLFTDQRLLEFEKRKKIHSIQLADITEVKFNVEDRVRNDALGLDNVTGKLLIIAKDQITIEIKIDEKNSEVQDALSAVISVLNTPIEVVGDLSFKLEASLSTAELVEMKQDGLYVNISMNSKTFLKTESEVNHDHGLIMDKTHYKQIMSEPVFLFMPVCAWSGEPVNGKTKSFSYETDEYDMKDINPILNMGKTLASFILTAGKRVDHLVRFIFQFELPVADSYTGDDAPQWHFYFLASKAVLSIKFPTNEMAAEFVEHNSKMEKDES
jgi:hypothetical protein